jgi:serine/threonine protein kinase
MENRHAADRILAYGPHILDFGGVTYKCALVTHFEQQKHSSILKGTPLESCGGQGARDGHPILVKFYRPGYETLALHAQDTIRYLQNSGKPCYRWFAAARRVNPLFPHEGEVPYILRDWFEGRSLLETLHSGHAEDTSWSFDFVLREMSFIASRLEVLHADTEKHPGIVHRDIKPSNILLLDNPACQIAFVDFDLSCIVGETSTFARNKAFHGTYVYLPPEHFLEKNAPDSPHPSWDMFSLGVLFYEILEGCWPFPVSPVCLTDESFWTRFFKTGTLRRPLKLDTELKDLIFGLLDFDWRARPTAGEIACLLDTYRRSLSSSILNRQCTFDHCFPGPNPTPLYPRKQGEQYGRRRN